MAITFDGAAKRIVLGAGTVTLEVRDLWSRWVDWLAESDNSKYPPALRQVGGDIIEIPIYVFLLNGWRIVPQAADHTLSVSDGVLVVDGGGDPFVNPAGDHAIRISYQAPGIAIGYSTTGSSGPSASDIAAAVLSAMNSAPPGVDVKRMNGAQVIGTGAPDDLWRGVTP